MRPIRARAFSGTLMREAGRSLACFLPEKMKKRRVLCGLAPGFAWRECVFEGERLRVVQAECEAKEGEDRATWYRADATSFEALPDGSDVLRVLNLRYPEAASQKEAQQYVAAISALALQLRGGASLPEAASTQKTWTLDARGAATTLTFEGKRWS